MMKVITEETIIIYLKPYEAAEIYKEIQKLSIHPTKWGQYPHLEKLFNGLYPTIRFLLDEEDD